MAILPYIVFFFAFFLFANFDFWGLKFDRVSKNSILVVLFALMTLFAGLRWFDYPLNPEPGVWKIFDYSAYEHVYDNPMSISNFMRDFIEADIYTKSMDVGYVYISSFFSNYIFDDANIFFLLTSLITVVIFAKSLKRNKIEYALFFVLFIFATRLYLQYNFIMMRQALAMSIVWWAIPYVIERRLWKFVMFCAIGGIFHFTSFLFIIVYWIHKLKFSNKFLSYTLPILFLLGISGVTGALISFGMDTAFSLVGLDSKFAGYIMGSEYQRGINPLNFLEIAPFLYFALKYRDEMTKTPNGKFFFNLFIFYTIFLLVTMSFMALTRISSYYLYSVLYIISFVMSRPIHYSNKLLVGYALSFYFLLYGVRFALANFGNLGYHIFFIN